LVQNVLLEQAEPLTSCFSPVRRVPGEVKEIRETPHKRHHKFVEFYDARGAEAALKGLNRAELKGKRIKLEPSRPGGTRRGAAAPPPGPRFTDEEVRTLFRGVGSSLSSACLLGYALRASERGGTHAVSWRGIIPQQCMPAWLRAERERARRYARCFVAWDHPSAVHACLATR
jgi:hypothetical protein